MKIRKILSTIIVLTLMIGVFGSFSVFADPIMGATEEILSFNFEDGNKTPAYTYEGSTYTSTTSNQVWTSSATDDIWGKRFDRSLCLYSTTGAHSWFFATTKSTNSSLLDIGGGCAVVSFEMALKNTDTASTNFYIYYNRKDSGGSFAGKTLNLQFDTSGILLNTGSSLYNAYIVSGNVPREEWHSYDVVFVYGTNQLKVYRDGTLIGNLDSENVYGSGYTFAGLGQTGYDNMFAARITSGVNGNTAYYDNFKVRRYSSAETFTPKFKENLSTATDNTLTTSGTYLNRTDGDFKVVTGAFGKAATDKSFKIVRADGVTTGGSYQDNFYQKANYGSGFQYGGKLHIGFNIAMEGVEREFIKYLYLKPTGGTGSDVLYLKYGTLSSGNTSVPINWESNKWYKFDVYITPGDGTNVKNKMTVYMNGKKMLENIELADTAFSSIESLRLGQREKFIESGSTYEYNQVLYFDDISFEYIPSGINVTYPNVTISSLDESVIRIVDNDTMLAYNNPTVSGVKAVVAASNFYAVSDEVTPVASDSVAAVGTYFLIKATDDIRYLFPIVDRIDRYSEDFSDGIYENNTPIKSWTFLTGESYTGSTSQATAVGGKKATDKSYINSAGRSGQNYQFTDKPISVDGQTIIEFSMLMNDKVANDGIGFGFQYKDALGNKQNSSLYNLIWLWNNQIRICTTNSAAQTIGSYADNQWNKFAFVIDPTAFTADVYLNGQLVSENAKFLTDAEYTSMEGCEMTGIYRLKFEHSSNSSTSADYSALDDIKVYQGTYNNAADTMTLTAPNYVLYNNWIAIPETTDVSDFEAEVSISNATISGIFDNNAFESTEYADDYDIIMHDQYLVCETPGGAFYYYRIVEQDAPVKVIKKTVVFDDTADVLPGSALDLGQYSFRIQYEKYNNNTESAYLILAKYVDDNFDQLENIKISLKSLVFGSNETSDIEIEVDDSDNVLRAMVWAADDITPLCPATTYGLDN